MEERSSSSFANEDTSKMVFWSYVLFQSLPQPQHDQKGVLREFLTSLHKTMPHRPVGTAAEAYQAFAAASGPI